MTVKELRGMLADAPDELEIMVMIEDHLKPGMFAFTSACSCDTGVTTLGPDEHGNPGHPVFLVLPHGSGVPEDQLDELADPMSN